MIHLIGLYVYFTFPPAFLLLAVLVLPLPLFMRKLVVRLADAVLFFHVRLGSLRLTMFHLLQLFSTLTFVWMWMYVLRCVVFVGVWAVHSVCLCACFVCVCNLRDYTCVCVCVCVLCGGCARRAWNHANDQYNAMPLGTGREHALLTKFRAERNFWISLFSMTLWL